MNKPEKQAQNYRLLLEKAVKPLPIVDYSFASDSALELMKTKLLPSTIQNTKIKTEFDLAQAWSGFAKKLLGQRKLAESEIVCWDGHYDQLGRVMLELMRMSRDKPEMLSKEEVYEMIPDLEEITFIGKPGRIEDKMFCRIWLSLIRHPAFLELEIHEKEVVAFQYWQNLFTLALGKTNSELLKQNA